jgi:integrase
LLGECPRLADLAHGRWYFAVQAPTPSGRRARVRRGGFETRAEAERARIQFLRLSPTVASGRAWTVSRWLEHWLSGLAGNVRPSTLRGYREHVHHYLIPNLGRIRLSGLRTAHVQAMFRLISSGRTRSGRIVAASTLNRIRGTLRSALAEAVRDGYLVTNPARGLRLPGPRNVHPVVWTKAREEAWRRTGARPAVAVWTREHLASFLAQVDGDPLFALWWLVAVTGLRRGEVCGLRWDDVDLDGATITVHEQVVVVDGQDVIGPPKSASSRRTIAIDPVSVKLLCELAARGHRTAAFNPQRRVFTDTKGRPPRPDYLTRRFNALVLDSGLPPVRFHDLRHGAATYALAAGVDLKVVQAMLGHASIVTTADTYTSVLTETAHQAAKASANLILDAARNVVSLRGGSQA